MGHPGPSGPARAQTGFVNPCEPPSNRALTGQAQSPFGQPGHMGSGRAQEPFWRVWEALGKTGFVIPEYGNMFWALLDRSQSPLGHPGQEGS